MSPDPYFHLFQALSRLSFAIFNDTLYDYTTGQRKVSYARMKTFFHFLILSPDANSFGISVSYIVLYAYSTMDKQLTGLILNLQ